MLEAKRIRRVHDTALKDALQELEWLIREATKIRDNANEHLKPEHSHFSYRSHHSVVHLAGSASKIVEKLSEATAYGRVLEMDSE